MRGSRLYLIIALVVTVVFLLIVLRSCRQGGGPASLQEDAAPGPVSTLVVPATRLG